MGKGDLYYAIGTASARRKYALAAAKTTTISLGVTMAKTTEDWMTSKWRPMMAVTYMAINIFDFILGPILFNTLQFFTEGQHVGMWQPLTLQGGGLIHIAFGAILGISAWTRGQEKVAAIEAGKTEE